MGAFLISEKKIFFVFAFLLINTVHAAPGAKNAVPSRSPATTKSSRAGEPIEVRGQSRNLNMLLILQQQGEVIDFIKLRDNYQQEMKKTAY